MKTLLFALALSTSASAFAECKLKTPIDLRELQFTIGVEKFSHAESAPDMRTIISKQSESFFYLPTTFALTYVQDFASNLRNGTLNPRVLGARIALGDTVHYIGMSDYFTNSTVERTLTKTQSGEIHVVKKYWEEKLSEMSVVEIVGSEVVRVEVSDSFFGDNFKTACVTEISR